MGSTVLNNFEKIGVCPQGNMAETTIGIYCKQKVVLKQLVHRLLNQDVFLSRWHREIEASKTLSKVINVPHVIEYDDEPFPWYLQEYIEGVNLRAWINNNVYPLKTEKCNEAMRIVLSIIEMIEKSTSMGFVHRDLTPENIILSNNLDVYIIDWGLVYISPKNESCQYDTSYSNLLSDRLTECGRRHGKVGYACPEQYDAFNDVPSIKNDIYSIVILLIELLTGTPLFGLINNYEEIVDYQRKIASKYDLLYVSEDSFLSELYIFLIGDLEKRCIDSKLLKDVIRKKCVYE